MANALGVTLTDAKIRMLFFPAEFFPTTRVRLNVLFGRELLAREHAIDLVMQAGDSLVRVGRHDWHGRSVWVGSTDCRDGFRHRLRKHALGVWHDLAWLWRARATEYDCILVSDKFLLASIAALLARARGMKFFFWLTFAFHKSHVLLGKEGIARYPALSMLRGHIANFFLHHWIVPLSHHVFVQSQYMADDFCRHGADPEALTPVVTGIDLGEIAPVVSAVHEKRDRPLTIAYIGTLARERRLEILVDMLADLRQRCLVARLLLVGDGETPEDRLCIMRRARQVGVSDQIEITGFLPRALALERVKDADICVSPIYPSPIFDGASPTKLVEYMALGIPVVANSHPDQSLVLKGSRAGVCVPWGARHFARAIHWLAHRSDGELAEIGQRGRAWVEENRSYSGIADGFERACLKAINSGASKARW
jgi:glycosyltransferase involved in cell wall biosynthesis